MTRYIVVCEDLYVAACQPDTKVVSLTYSKEDAGSWVTYERAVKAALLVAELRGTPVAIHMCEEPAYPVSWNQR